MNLLKGILEVLSSYALACVLLLILLLLTFLGTIEQAEHGLWEVQRKYFESLWLVHDLFGVVPLPLPGAYPVMALLAVNLIIGGLVRLRWRWSIAGVVICHIGIVLLFLAAFVKFKHSDDGKMTLYEGWHAAEFDSYHDWQLTITTDIALDPTLTGVAGIGRAPSGQVTELVVPMEHLRDLDASGGSRTFTSPELPFSLRVDRFFRNANVLKKGPMFDVDVPVIDGFFLQRLKLDPTSEANIAGAYVTMQPADRTPGSGGPTQFLLWGHENFPYTIEMGDQVYTVSLDRRRWQLPFTVQLEDFRRELHPGTTMAAAFESDISKISRADGSREAVTISMNRPLRREGFVLFQASWGPENAQPGDALFSTFAVVRNPSDHWPLYACIIIGIGLFVHFIGKLIAHLRVTASRRA